MKKHGVKIMNKTLAIANQLKSSFDEVFAYRRELGENLSLVDKKRSDVEHFMEISQDKNASEGYALYKMLREILRERREIKNEIDELDILIKWIREKGIAENHNLGKTITEVESKIAHNSSEESAKSYRVRVLTEVFGSKL